MYVSTAKDYTGTKNNQKKISRRIADFVENLPATATEGLPRELPLFVGMPVFVTRNLHTELGITNGATGRIASIHYRAENVIQGTDSGLHRIEHSPEYIIVEMDHVSMRRLEGLPPNHVPIFPRTRSVCVKMPRMKKKTSFSRCQFPIVPKFSCTSHKSQGQTLPKAIVDLTPTGRHVGVEFAYVPLSRVRTLSDLMLLRPIDRSILRIRVNEACAVMMEEFKDRDICKDM